MNLCKTKLSLIAVLSPNCITKQYSPFIQYLQLMERFEIALSLDEKRLLIPSMLPNDSPGIQRDMLLRAAKQPGLKKKRSQTFTASSFPHSNLSKEKSSSTLPRPTQSGQQKEAAAAESQSDDVDGSVDDDGFPKDPIDAVRRSYQMAYIPSGFWSRLITRLMVSLQRWRVNEGIDEQAFFMIYWRKGISVIYDGGHFMVQSYKELVRFYHY